METATEGKEEELDVNALDNSLPACPASNQLSYPTPLRLGSGCFLMGIITTT